MSNTLEILLDKDRYNRQMRPPGQDQNSSPVQVQINMAIRSMGPVDEVRELFSLDCYFRQSWTDKRLRLVTHLFLEIGNWKNNKNRKKLKPLDLNIHLNT